MKLKLTTLILLSLYSVSNVSGEEKDDAIDVLSSLIDGCNLNDWRNRPNQFIQKQDYGLEDSTGHSVPKSDLEALATKIIDKCGSVGKLTVDQAANCVTQLYNDKFNNGKLDGHWQSKRYGQLRITTKRDEFVIEIPGEPKAFGNLNGNTGEMWFPTNAACDYEAFKKDRDNSNPFTLNGDIIKVEGDVGENWSRVGARAMTADEKAVLKKSFVLNDGGNHNKDGSLTVDELAAAFMR